ncbi:hypothetical protein RD1_3537 [Roseobacter denitrificans OCh 114]|uniref:Uncharacterized protein n=1 Tax=Roseobacter denitrificans (strain ATCC 33942 / OCh 114) TaxID=375451 RepID=Q162S5_ROSDO|nr:hypothetical protein RD1_3537 [Roseobacter denitrificans OCh 114]
MHKVSAAQNRNLAAFALQNQNFLEGQTVALSPSA